MAHIDSASDKIVKEAIAVYGEEAVTLTLVLQNLVMVAKRLQATDSSIKEKMMDITMQIIRMLPLNLTMRVLECLDFIKQTYKKKTPLDLH